MDEEIKEKLSNTSTWLRGLYLLLFIFILEITKLVTAALALFQFFNTLFTGASNERLSQFGQTLSRYMAQTVLFLSYSTEEKPFPFTDWPSQEDTQQKTPVVAKKKTNQKTATESKQTPQALPDKKEGDDSVNYQ